MRPFYATILIAVIFSACGRTRQTPPPQPEAVPLDEAVERVGNVDRPLPKFSLPTLSGSVLDADSLRGKVTIINFWATWCGPCVVEIPEFVALRDEWSGRPFEIVGVASDWEGFEVVRVFAEDFQMNYPVVSDSSGLLGEAFGGVYALPTSFIVDANGIVVRRVLGMFPFDTYRSELDGLIRKAPGP